MGGGQPEEQSGGTRDHPRHRQAAERRRQPHARCALWSSRETHIARESCWFTSVCDLCHGKVSPQLPDGNDCADYVINFDELVKMRSNAGVDGALERSGGFLLLF